MDSSAASLSKVLGDFAIFADLADHHLEALAQRSHRRHVARGSYLFHRGSDPVGFWGVVSGMMRLSVSNAQGAVKVVEILGPQESFGEAVMFLERPYPVDASALVDTELVFIDSSVINQLLATDLQFARRILASMAMRLHTRVSDIEMYTLRTATQRVVGMLMGDLVDKDDNTASRVSLPAAKQVVASRLGLTPETFSRVLRDLSDKNLISVEGSDIEIPDIRALARQDTN